MVEKVIVIIPARSGSKRLPGKNSLLLGDIPLIEHSINYALSNKDLLDRIIVSTDDKKIRKIAIQKGIEIIDRPKYLSTDTSTTIAVLKHVLETINEQDGKIILLQPTNPLRPINLLRESLKIFTSGKYDSLMTVSRSLEKLGKIVNNKFVPFNYSIGQRSQNLEPLFAENGLLYITQAALILEGKLLGENNFPFIVDHPFAEVDIDYKADLDYAEYLLEREKKNKI